LAAQLTVEYEKIKTAKIKTLTNFNFIINASSSIPFDCYGICFIKIL